MNSCLTLKALSAGMIAAMAVANAQAAPIDFVFNSAAIIGSTTNYTFTADEMTFTPIGAASIIQVDTSAPYGVLGMADDFFEIGFTSLVNFQLNNHNIFGAGINIGTGGYELVAQFTMSGNAGFAGSLLQTNITGGGVTIYYDEVQDNIIGPTAIPIGTLLATSGACIVTSLGGAIGVPDGSCSVAFAFDPANFTNPGVWTLGPGGPDIRTLNSTFVMDTDIDELTQVSLQYPGFGVTCDVDIDGGADACEQTFTASYDGSGVVYVPEPATLTLFGMGLLGLGARARRKQPQKISG
ncbi:MAG TPA: flocculation-associated PEP-CTERM protein PepA [Burkholderiales bacterium]|nr:flocculation-associated PEP-CTERM protein PepA [Burkholderiales bacterium]